MSARRVDDVTSNVTFRWLRKSVKREIRPSLCCFARLIKYLHRVCCRLLAGARVPRLLPLQLAEACRLPSPSHLSLVVFAFLGLRWLHSRPVQGLVAVRSCPLSAAMADLRSLWSSQSVTPGLPLPLSGCVCGCEVLRHAAKHFA